MKSGAHCDLTVMRCLESFSSFYFASDDCYYDTHTIKLLGTTRCKYLYFMCMNYLSIA